MTEPATRETTDAIRRNVVTALADSHLSFLEIAQRNQVVFTLVMAIHLADDPRDIQICANCRGSAVVQGSSVRKCGDCAGMGYR